MHIFFTTCLLLIYLPLMSQSKKHYIFQNFSTIDGLSQNSISQVMQDREGMVWVSTQGGIDKFVGGKIQSITGFKMDLQEKISYLYDWSADSILISTDKENYIIPKWNYKRVLTSPRLPKSIIKINNLNTKKRIIFTKRSIFLSDGDQLKDITNSSLKDCEFFQVIQLSSFRWLIGTSKGIFLYDYKKRIVHSLIKFSHVFSIYYDKKSSTFYFGQENSFVSVYHLKKNKLIFITKLKFVNSMTAPSRVTSILLGADSMIWVGTENSGLYLRNLKAKNDPKDKCFHKYCALNSTFYFSSNTINCLFASAEGVIWIGTELGGVNIWQPHRQFFFHGIEPSQLSLKAYEYLYKKPEYPLHGNDVWSILADDDEPSVWVGLNKNGLVKFNYEEKKIVKWLHSKDKDNNSNTVYTLKAHGNSLLIGTKNGLYYKKKSDTNGLFEPFKINGTHLFNGKKITILEFDAQKQTWIIGRKGSRSAFIYDRWFNLIDSLNTIEKDEYISFVTIGKDFPIVGTNQGLYKISYQSKQLQSIGEVKDKVHFMCALQQGDKLWLGTYRSGLFFYDLKSQKNIIFSEVLKNEVIYDLRRDQNGDIWLSSNHGIYQYNPSIKSLNHYIIADGLKVYEYNGGACTSNKTRMMFFGGINGFNYFTPNKRKSQDSSIFKPILKIQYDANNFRSSIQYQQLSTSNKGEVSLPFSIGDLVIYPILGHYQNPRNNEFVITFNRTNIARQEDGTFRIAANQIHDGLSWKKNLLVIKYRTGSGEWQPAIEVCIKRDFFSFGRLLLVLVFLFVIAAFLFIFGVNKKIKKKSETIAQNAKDLEKIQAKINEISRLEKTDIICESALNHFILDFEFDFAAISLIDFYKKWINLKYAKDPLLSSDKIISWKNNSNYPLGDRDILAQISTIGEHAIVIGNKSYNPKLNHEGLLNPTIVSELNHENLSRMFIPIIHRSLPVFDTEYGENNEDTVLGVVEIGYHGFPSRIKEKLELDKTRIELYIDNLAQTYYKAYIKEKTIELYRFIEQLEKDNELDHNAFLKLSLEQLSTRLGVNYADVSLTKFNQELIDFSIGKLSIGYNFNELEAHHAVKKDANIGKLGIIRHVSNTKRFYYTGNVKENDKYIEFIPNVASELAIPMILNEDTSLYGVFNFMSDKPNYFNKIIANIYQKGIKKITEIYIKKKQYEYLIEMNTHMAQFTQSESTLFWNVVNSLRGYFQSEYISVWIRGNSEELSSFFLSKDATIPSFYHQYEQFGFLEAKIKEEYKNAELIGIKEIEKIEKKSSRVYQFCNQAHLNFKGYIILKIILDEKYQAFINIFSKRNINPDEVEGYTKAFLLEVSKKTTLAIQNIRLTQTIEIIATALAKRETENPLQRIVEQAYYLLPSVDSVVLFKYQKDLPILLKDAIVGGNLPAEDIIDPYRPVVFANYIIKNGSKIVESEADFISLVGSTTNQSLTRKSFWKKRKLQSVAAIRIDILEDPIGVIFFNFAQSKKLKEGETHKLIYAFTDFVKIAMINESYISRIQAEKEKLTEQNQILAQQTHEIIQQKTKVQADLDVLQQKMEEMLPQAAGASFFLILQGINHDIRNLLTNMSIQLYHYLSSAPKQHKESVQNLIDRVKENALKIETLLKLFNPNEQNKTEQISINEVLNDVIKFFTSQTSNIRFVKEFQEKMPGLLCYKYEFSMVIYNLIKNAVRAINEKNKQVEGVIKVTSMLMNKWFFITIEDNGIGMDASLKEKIFTFGYTTKEEGLGIGLYFVRESIRNKLEGDVYVSQTDKGKGTTFTIEIPLFINYKN